MVRKALRTGCAIQRGPVVGMIYKIAAGNPQSEISGEKDFWVLLVFSKVPRSATDWHRNTPWKARQSNKRERQAKRTNQNNRAPAHPPLPHI